MTCVKTSLSVLNGTRNILKLNCMKKKNIFCIFILLLSVYLPRITGVIGKTLIFRKAKYATMLYVWPTCLFKIEIIWPIHL